MQSRRFSFSRLGLACLGLGLLACGGRTLDNGVYGVNGVSGPGNGTTSCSYKGKAYSDGTLIADACVCFCNKGQIECEQGCSIGSGGNSSGGASSGTGGDGNASSGGVSTAGTASGGTFSTGGTASAGSSSGGTAGVSSGGSMSTGGVAGTGGSMSTGGVAGTGGGTTMICNTRPRASGANPMIDDMEDGNAYILPVDGRSGVWFTYNDGSPGGYQFPSVGSYVMQGPSSDATGGKFAANTYGKGFFSWGAGMGFVVNSGCPYDASVESGLHFFVRAEIGSGSLYVLVPTAATTPSTNGGTCIQSTSMSCYDDYQLPLTVTTEWVEEYVPFSVLFQQGWGTRVSFDPHTLIGVNFQTLPGAANQFSFSIDSISFY